jgi:hypothetical protein
MSSAATTPVLAIPVPADGTVRWYDDARPAIGWVRFRDGERSSRVDCTADPEGIALRHKSRDDPEYTLWLSTDDLAEINALVGRRRG